MTEVLEENEGAELEWPAVELAEVSRFLRETGPTVPPAIMEAADSLRVAATFFGDLRDAGMPSPKAMGATLQPFRRSVASIRVVALAAQTSQRWDDPLIARAQAEALAVEAAVRDLIADLIAKVRPIPSLNTLLLPVLERHEERFAARALAHEARGARDEVLEVLDSTREAAGAVGEMSMAKHFADYAKRETHTANVLRAATILLLLAVTAFAGLLLLDDQTPGVTVGEELAKLAITLPVAALAAYLGREAAGHRRAALWASELETQLLTMDAFAAPLPEDMRHQLRMELGRRVIAPGQPGAVASAPATANDVAGLLGNLSSLVRPAASEPPRP